MSLQEKVQQIGAISSNLIETVQPAIQVAIDMADTLAIQAGAISGGDSSQGYQALIAAQIELQGDLRDAMTMSMHMAEKADEWRAAVQAAM